MSAQVISALPVPFTTEGEVDVAAYEEMLEGVGPYVAGALVAGTTAEFPALEDTERIDLFRRAVAQLGADRVIAHVGHGSTRQVLRMADAATDLGISRMALLTPYYLPTDDDGVVAFFEALTTAHPEADVYAYLFPDRTGMTLGPDVLARVMALPGLRGVKLSGGAAAELTALRGALQDGQELYSGDDSTLPFVLEQGGHGVVSGVSSAFPQVFAALTEALDGGDPAAVEAAQQTARKVVGLTGPTITRLKVALRARTGRPWASRMALPGVDDGLRREIEAAVERHR